MRILYISPKIPYPLSDGGRLRVFNHIKHLSEKHEITSLSFIENKKQCQNVGELKKYCEVENVMLPKYKSLLNVIFGLFSKKPLRVSYFKDKWFAEKVETLTREADLVIIQSLRMVQYSSEPKKTIIDIVDTPSLQMGRALEHENFIWKLIWSIELPRIVRYEKIICNRFNTILVASKADKDALGKGMILKNNAKISNIRRKQVSDNNLMFLGNMEYPPNIDAVKYFIKNIFPLIKKEVKDAKFYIVGKNARKIKKLANKDIIVTGFIENLGEMFSKCKVFVAPLRLGSGIQNKVLEALNYEIPIVATSIVNNGIEAKPKKEILIADSPEDFAKKAISLIKNKKLRDRVSYNGKKFLRKNYSEDKINNKMERIINII